MSFVLKRLLRIREEFESDSTSLVNELCDVKQILQKLVQFHCDTFVSLHVECKKGKNSQLQFHIVL